MFSPQEMEMEMSEDQSNTKDESSLTDQLGLADSQRQKQYIFLKKKAKVLVSRGWFRY